MKLALYIAFVGLSMNVVRPVIGMGVFQELRAEMASGEKMETSVSLPPFCAEGVSRILQNTACAPFGCAEHCISALEPFFETVWAAISHHAPFSAGLLAWGASISILYAAAVYSSRFRARYALSAPQLRFVTTIVLRN